MSTHNILFCLYKLMCTVTVSHKSEYTPRIQCAACIEVHIYCPLNITQHITIIAQITGNKNDYTLSEHVKTVSKVSIFL